MGCVSISVYVSLVGIPADITSPAIGLKIYSITAGIKKYKVITKKNLIDSYISNDNFF